MSDTDPIRKSYAAAAATSSQSQSVSTRSMTKETTSNKWTNVKSPSLIPARVQGSKTRVTLAPRPVSSSDSAVLQESLESAMEKVNLKADPDETSSSDDEIPNVGSKQTTKLFKHSSRGSYYNKYREILETMRKPGITRSGELLNPADGDFVCALSLARRHIIDFDFARTKHFKDLNYEVPFYKLPFESPAPLVIHRNSNSYLRLQKIRKPFERSVLAWIKECEQDGVVTKDMLVWDELLSTVTKFYPSTDCLPEEQYRVFWSRILEIITIDRNPDIAYVGLEFKMNTMSSYEKTSNVDVALLFKKKYFEFEPVPFFVGEAAAEEVTNDNKHKDYEKLANEMLCALLNILGLVTGASLEVKNSLVIFGGLMGRLSFQWCILFPVIDKDSKMSFIFETEKGLTLNLINPQSPSAELIDKDFKLVCKPLLVAQITGARQKLKSLLPENSVSTDEEFNDWKKGERAHHFSNAISKEQKETLCMMFEMGKVMSDYTIRLKGILDQIQKNDKSKMTPIMLPNNMKKDLPSSRSSHSSKHQLYEGKTPKNHDNLKSVTRDVVNQYQLGVIGEEHTSNIYLTRCSYKNSVLMVVAKTSNPHYVQKEVEMLKHCSDCYNIVSVIQSSVNQDLKVSVMVQEELLDYRTYWSIQHDRHGGEIPDAFHILYSCNYMLDGIAALEQLKSQHIVHRDISPSNFMYSYVSRCWRLIDFETAIKVENEHGVFIDKKVYGTRDYIAPEVETDFRYSFMSDMYSFGRTAEYTVADPCVCWCMKGMVMLNRIAINLVFVCDEMTSDVPEDRLIVTFDDHRRNLFDIVIQALKHSGTLEALGPVNAELSLRYITQDILEDGKHSPNQASIGEKTHDVHGKPSSSSSSRDLNQMQDIIGKLAVSNHKLAMI